MLFWHPRSVSNAVAQAASVLAAKQLVDEHIDVVAGDREKAALRLSRPEHRQI
jgi:hypothetical protein